MPKFLFSMLPTNDLGFPYASCASLDERFASEAEGRMRC